MRFASVLFLAAWQLTAVPFVSLLVAQSQRQPVSPVSYAASENVTVVYKTADRTIASNSFHLPRAE